MRTEGCQEQTQCQNSHRSSYQKERNNPLSISTVNNVTERRFTYAVGDGKRQSDIAQLQSSQAVLLFEQGLCSLEVIAHEVHAHVGDEDYEECFQKVSEPKFALLR
ncbi:hypothetical protein GCM10007338_06220 [Corynebacterium pelargi]|nr:hypothetical protein GCM10007338_06220 [Corynebacterium pelargi]